jgi:hypothetical protein
VRIDGERYAAFKDRSGTMRSPSFVFTTEAAVVAAAYKALAQQLEDE